jgi:hypothetical protein
MTVNAVSDWPEEPEDEFDDVDDDDRAEDLADDLDDDLSIEFAIDQHRSRLTCVYTRGLWEYGIPELCTKLPEHLPEQLGPPDELKWGSLACSLATGLIYLGQELMAVDHFLIPRYHGEFDEKPIQMWLDRQEPPEGSLALALGPAVDTVMWVNCSLWHPVPDQEPSA